MHIYILEVKDFVTELFNSWFWCSNQLYDIESAKFDVDVFKKEEACVIPDDLTPENLMEIWNELALASHKFVYTADKKRVARYTLMSDKQIANTIISIWDLVWDDVSDLIYYVADNYLHLERDKYGRYIGDWEKKVEEWCNSVK